MLAIRSSEWVLTLCFSPVVSFALTLAEYLVASLVLHGFAPIEHRLHHANPDGAVLTIFGKYGFVSSWSI